MASMTSSEHSQRWKTAAVLLTIIATVGWIDSTFITWLFLGLVYAMAIQEAKRLFEVHDVQATLYPLLLWLALPLSSHPSDFIFVALAIFGAGLAYRQKGEPKLLFLLLYPTAGMIFLWMLYLHHGMISLLWILLIVALSDVGAYYSGRRFGKTPFSPTSPKKTLEGVYGGIVLGTLGGALLMGDADLSLGSALLLAFFTSLASIFGDLFESWLKRRAGVKDSGMLLPGHGGILDRIDGYLFASIVLYTLLESIRW